MPLVRKNDVGTGNISRSHCRKEARFNAMRLANVPGTALGQREADANPEQGVLAKKLVGRRGSRLHFCNLVPSDLNRLQAPFDAGAAAAPVREEETMMRSAFIVAALVSLAALSGSASAQTAPAPKLGTLEEAPDTPQACNTLIEKSKAAMPTAKLSADEKGIVERAIRWGELWRTQAAAGLGAPGYRRCAISLRPAVVLLKVAI
jgi:hypothetical protein